MAEDLRKTELTARLANLRAELSGDFRAVRRHLDLPAQLKKSYGRHQGAWLGGAAVLGWVLARLPARKKKVKVYVDRKDERMLKEATQAGAVLVIGKLLFSALRPAITAFATKKITDLVTHRKAPSRINKGARG